MYILKLIMAEYISCITYWLSLSSINEVIQDNGENTISAMKDDIKLLRKELISKSDEHELKLRRDVKTTDDRINAIERQYGKFLI